MNWMDKKKLDKLAELKAQIQILEEEAKAIQTYLIDTYKDALPKKHTTAEGTLTLTTRKNYSKPDNNKVITVIGLDPFIQNATISVTNIKKAGGELALNKLIAQGDMEALEPTVYYQLKREK